MRLKITIQCLNRSVFQNNIEGVHDTRDPSKDGQKTVDPEVRVTSSFQEDTYKGLIDMLDNMT